MRNSNISEIDGSLIRGTLYTNSRDKICSIDFYHWSKGSYEKALDSAGFTDIKWSKYTKSSEMDTFFGKKKADESINNLPTIGLKCQKP